MVVSLDETQPISLLTAVNICLNQIGHGPVPSLSAGDTTFDSDRAQSRLLVATHDLCEMGWSFNTEKKYVITPDVNGYLTLPNNCLKVDTAYTDKQDLDLVQRGSKLYDRVNHTDVFTDSVYVDMVVGLSFEEIPPAARKAITYSAARQFAGGEEASANAARVTEKDENRAWANFFATESANDDRTLATANTYIAWMRRR